MKRKRSNCPQCGYPSKGKYENNPCFGIYTDGGKCGGCGYVDEEAAAANRKLEAEKDIRVQQLRDNPPQFKSVEDWENWNQEEHLK